MSGALVELSNINYLSPENVKNNVLPHYGLSRSVQVTQVKFKDTDKQRAVYKVEDGDKYYCLKKVYYPIDELLFIYSTIEWLYRNNIKVPRIISTLNHGRYVEYNNMLFILTDWIEGEKCDFDNLNHVNLASSNLSKMHKVSSFFMPILGSANKEGFLDLGKSLKKHTLQLIENEKLALRYNDYFSKIFILSYTNAMSSATLSTAIADKINPSNLTKAVCHNDYVSKNLIVKDDHIYVIDFDKCKYDYCALDISYCLRRLLRRENTCWNIDLAINFLQQYELNNELTLDDYRYILAYLSFPQKYWKLSRDYYKNISKCNKNAFVALLNKSLSNNHLHREFNLNLLKYVENKFDTRLV